MKLTLEYVEKDYKNLKKVAKKELDKKNYNDCLNLISCVANIAYHLNFRFYDDELEEYLKTISFDLINTIDFEPIQGRWIFYDYFGLDNRGLTQQYLNVLDDMGVEYLYILERYISDYNHKDIINQVENNTKAEIYINDSSLDFKVQIENITKVLDDYRPEKALLHLAPWSCLSIVLWDRLNFVERYFINLTDHAFWLGKNSFDYCLEFREYGINLSKKYRDIDYDRLLLQKFYPIQTVSNFEGFPVDINDKTIILTGGSFYKMYGDNDMFFNILKRIAIENDQVVIFIAGSGFNVPLINFISQNNLNQKIILINNRKDINMVLKNSHIHINTYPIMGALMAQLAIYNDIPTINYTNEELSLNFVDNLFDFHKTTMSYTDLSRFHFEINKLIKDQKYRLNVIADYKKLKITREDFKENFKNIIHTKTNKISFQAISINTDEISDLYLKTENNYLKQYDLIKFKWLGLKYFKFDLVKAIFSVIKLVVFNRELIFNKIKKKMSIK